MTNTNTVSEDRKNAVRDLLDIFKPHFWTFDSSAEIRYKDMCIGNIECNDDEDESEEYADKVYEQIQEALWNAPELPGAPAEAVDYLENAFPNNGLSEKDGDGTVSFFIGTDRVIDNFEAQYEASWGDAYFTAQVVKYEYSPADVSLSRQYIPAAVLPDFVKWLESLDINNN